MYSVTEWTERKLGLKVNVDTKGTDRQKAVNGICGKGAEAQQGNQRVDKLLCIRLNENGNE